MAERVGELEDVRVGRLQLIEDHSLLVARGYEFVVSIGLDDGATEATH